MGTILVVDDEPDICLLARMTFEREGYSVVEAADGADALALVDASRPDAIVLDVMLPEVDGWTVLQQLKVHPDRRVREIPVVMLTALGSPLHRARGGIEGAVAYLAKPIDLDELVVAVREGLEGSEPERRRRAQRAGLELLARIEGGSAAPTSPGVRPRLSGLERGPNALRPVVEAPRRSLIDQSALLTAKQRQLLTAVGGARTVIEAAQALQMSRSNVYASLRRISRKLGVRSVTELLSIARSGDLSNSTPYL